MRLVVVSGFGLVVGRVDKLICWAELAIVLLIRVILTQTTEVFPCKLTSQPYVTFHSLAKTHALPAVLHISDTPFTPSSPTSAREYNKLEILVKKLAGTNLTISVLLTGVILLQVRLDIRAFLLLFFTTHLFPIRPANSTPNVPPPKNVSKKNPTPPIPSTLPPPIPLPTPLKPHQGHPPPQDLLPAGKRSSEERLRLIES